MVFYNKGSLLILVFAVAICIDISCSYQLRKEHNVSTNRKNIGSSSPKERLFALIRIHPTPCEISSSIGSCITSSLCTQRGGKNLGTCAKGFGVCCELTSTCSAQSTFVNVRDQASIIMSTGESTSCTYEFPKLEGSCQLMVDFEDVILGAPDIETGTCMTDRLLISGSVTVSNFVICGPNTNQRIFLTYGRNERVTLAFSTPNQSKYKLRVVHIPCDSPKLAPSHCLQYFNTSTGVVRSFSYGNGMINGQSYTVCIQETTPGTSFIDWSECIATTTGYIAGRSQFFLSNYFLPITQAAMDPVLMGMTGRSCDVTSYVEVFGEARHCGAAFRIPTSTGTFVPVQSRAKPYMLFVNVVGNTYPAPTPTTVNMIPFPYLLDTEVAPNPTPQHPCSAFGTATTGAQGFMPCGITATSRICSCTLLATPVMASNPPRSGFCLRYSVT